MSTIIEFDELNLTSELSTGRFSLLHYQGSDRLFPDALVVIDLFLLVMPLILKRSFFIFQVVQLPLNKLEAVIVSRSGMVIIADVRHGCQFFKYGDNTGWPQLLIYYTRCECTSTTFQVSVPQ